jgi:hypothetical protein
MKWIISKLAIQGVRGVLTRSGEFALKSKKGNAKSIAIFGRNGHGKSGYADAIEYLFSPDGGVDHLGKGHADSEQGGKHAMPHILAEEKGVVAQVEAVFVELETNEKIIVTRQVLTGRNDTRPTELDRVISTSPAHRVLRQHDLRRFVVDMPPGEKFSEFARWIGLEKVTKILSHLNTAERKLKETDVDREIAENEIALSGQTDGAVKKYDLINTLKWCENKLNDHVSESIALSKMEEIPVALEKLKKQKDAILLQSKAAKSYVTKENIKESTNKIGGENGQIQLARVATENVKSLLEKKNKAEVTAKESVFSEVWNNAAVILESEEMTVCPVCETPWEETSAGSASNAVLKIRANLGLLSAFKEASDQYTREVGTLNRFINDLKQSFEIIEKDTKNLSLIEVEKRAVELKNKWSELKDSEPNEIWLDSISTNLNECEDFVKIDIPKAIAESKNDTIPKVVESIDQLISSFDGLIRVVNRLGFLDEQRTAIRKVENDFAKVAKKIRDEAKVFAENAIGSLREDVEEIYKKVHSGAAVPKLYIELDAGNKTLSVRINFHNDERKLPPGGYLSEAQINTLGLGLFLSGVKLFNKDFPFLFLDDIVSSYDADCRARIVDVLAEYMTGFQIFLTTHDERFYAHLRERLASEDWIFEKISGYEHEEGPKRETDKFGDSQIEALLKGSDSRIAGNAVRQVIEEWFDKMCEHYQALTSHKRGSKDFQRTLYDYWGPFVARVSNIKGEYSPYFLESNEYKRFKSNNLINYYSHFQANPYEWSAIGDVKYTWETFKEFQSLFKCLSCKNQLKFDSGDSKLFCTCGGAFLPPKNPN